MKKNTTNTSPRVWQRAGYAAVDSGMMWVGDPCYCVTPDANEHPARTWSEFCDQVPMTEPAKQFHFKRGHEGLGVCVGGFGGDGVYPVDVRLDKDGLVTEIRVRFQER